MSGESPARDGGLPGRRCRVTGAPRAGRPRRRRAVAAAGAVALLAGLGGLAACGAPAPGVAVQPSATASQQLPLSPIAGQLIGVSAGPDGSVWAAGSTTSGRALIVHWSGATWSQAASPSLGGAALLHGVSAAQDGSAWAAGDTCASGCGTSSEADRTLILRWDGLSWSQTASPSPGSTAFLYGVSASPDGSAWAVGYTGTPSGADRTLILRWDGAAWSRTASPSPGRDAFLHGVSAGPGRTAWAVGYVCTSGCHTTSEADQMLILRWDGTSWSRAAAPVLGSSALL